MFFIGARRIFANRQEAGEKLSEELARYQNQGGAVVLAIPRGGVVVGAQIAWRLHLPLDVIVTRKLGAPGNPELAIGAVGAKGKAVLDEKFISELGISHVYLREEIARQKKEARRRERIFRGKGKRVDLQDKIVILVDDGIATGQTITAAICMLREMRVKKIVLAVPLGPKKQIDELFPMVDEMIVLEKPLDFGAVGQFYEEFAPVSDGEVIELLKSP